MAASDEASKTELPATGAMAFVGISREVDQKVTGAGHSAHFHCNLTGHPSDYRDKVN